MEVQSTCILKKTVSIKAQCNESVNSNAEINRSILSPVMSFRLSYVSIMRGFKYVAHNLIAIHV